MKEAMRWLIVLGILLVTFGLPVLLQTYLNFDKKIVAPTQNQAVEKNVTFQSVPPVLAFSGNVYSYLVIAQTSAGKTATITPVVKPEWLIWNSESNSLLGVVPSGIQSFTISLEATDGESAKSVQSFTVTIEVSQVKGATTTNQLWGDPFHPSEVTVYPTVSEIESNFDTTAVVPTVNVLGVTSAPTEQEKIRTYVMVGILLFIAGIFVSRLVVLLFTKNTKYFEGVVIQRRSSW